MSVRHEKARWVIKHIEEIVAGASLVAMVSVVIVNVLSRNLGHPIPWAEEFAVIGLVWSTFIGAAVCFKKNAHLAMDFLVTHLPIFARRVLQRFTMLLLFLLFLYLSYISAEFALTATKRTPFFRISYFYLNLPLALCFISMSIHSAIFLYQGVFRPERFDQAFVPGMKK